MKEDLIERRLGSILPDRGAGPGVPGPANEEIIKKAAAEVKAEAEKKTVRALKAKERAAQRRIEKSEQSARAKEKKLKEREERIEALEAIEVRDRVSSLDVTELAETTPASEYPGMVQKALQLQGASRPEIQKLLSALNINLSVRLSKADTGNLLACLLTCNESQLNALLGNPKVPVVIKTVIKRLLEDMKYGNTETVEKLWDRLFGKTMAQPDMSGPEPSLEKGIIPNVPVSREAYVIIRDTLIK